MKNIILIGYGALGRVIHKGILDKLSELYHVTGILEANADFKKDILDSGCKAYAALDEALADKPDYIVEAAGVGAVKSLALPVVEKGIPIIILSVGALADDVFREKLIMEAEKRHSKIHIPSGAIGGFDVLMTLWEMGMTDARIENYKPPQNLNGAPYLNGRELSTEHTETIFDGNAKEAIKGFPQNVNVAVSSGLAGIGLEKMQVMIQSDPGLKENVHIVTASSEHDSITVKVVSAPDEKNPKSSTITAWSVIALLRNLASPIEFF